MPFPSPLLYAHRGASREQPENTLPSFRRALELGAGALEMDLHMTADGYVVVSHDPDGRRLADVDEQIRRSTLSAVQRWGLGSTFVGRAGERYAGRGYRVPTLEEVLVEFPGVPINVDVKQREPPMVEPLLRLLRRIRLLARPRMQRSFMRVDLAEVVRRALDDLVDLREEPLPLELSARRPVMVRAEALVLGAAIRELLYEATGARPRGFVGVRVRQDGDDGIVEVSGLVSLVLQRWDARDRQPSGPERVMKAHEGSILASARPGGEAALTIRIPLWWSGPRLGDGPIEPRRFFCSDCDRRFELIAMAGRHASCPSCELPLIDVELLPRYCGACKEGNPESNQVCYRCQGPLTKL